MLTEEDVRKIAKLARLSLTDQEAKDYRAQLERVLEYVEEIKQAPQLKESFVRHVPFDSVSVREDREISAEMTDKILSNAPGSDGEYFVLPAVMESES